MGKNLVNKLTMAGHRLDTLLHHGLNPIQKALEFGFGVQVYQGVVSLWTEPLTMHDLQPPDWGKELGVVTEDPPRTLIE
jgi:hypothetical protein